MTSHSTSRRFFAPEVIQTSSMDCGPAALKSLLEGFSISVAYGRLREACQTDIDGTSIDTIEAVAREAGLDAEQIMVPVDHVLPSAAESLPAIAVVRNAAGVTHFVVVWRTHGRLVQVMDPARGRYWSTRSSLVQQLIQHTQQVPIDAWYRWAQSPEFLRPLKQRLTGIGIRPAAADALLREACASSDWTQLATLDAATRMMTSLTRAALPRRRAAVTLASLLTASFEARQESIPERYWSARPGKAPGTLAFRGAVLVRARRFLPDRQSARDPKTSSASSREVIAALAEPPLHPLRRVAAILMARGPILPIITAIALALAVIGVVLEASLLRAAIDVGTVLRGPEQRWWAGALLTSFAVLLLLLELVLGRSERQLGNRLEAGLRMAFLSIVPELPPAYFQSRPLADMLERSHSIHTIRMLPRLGVRFIRVALELFVTAAALAWLDLSLGFLALVAALAAAAIPLAAQALVAERDLKVRTHGGALAKYHLDALRGRTAIEAHGAGRTIEREHEGLLTEWAAATFSVQRASLIIETTQMVVGFGLVAWFLLGRVSSDAGPVLLLQTYWLLNLPGLGYELALIAREYPAHRSTLLRLLEPLGAGVSSPRGSPLEAETLASGPGDAIAVDMRGVSVNATGSNILDNVDLRITAGSHVAIVGASGAGKSSLIGVLLGFHRASSGEVLVDGQPLDDLTLDQLRQRTAWVDPTVQLWNASLVENLLYGTQTDGVEVGTALEATGLTTVVASHEDGLATELGESASLLSAGEAQRVRFARGFLKQSPRLVLLDEPFLGLERERRRTLLTQARARWRGVTTLYVTHDVNETRSFDHVVIVERGQVVEQGDPRALATSSSRYRRLLQVQETAVNRLGGADWRRVRMESGRVALDHARTSEQSA